MSFEQGLDDDINIGVFIEDINDIKVSSVYFGINIFSICDIGSVIIGNGVIVVNNVKIIEFLVVSQGNCFEVNVFLKIGIVNYNISYVVDDFEFFFVVSSVEMFCCDSKINSIGNFLVEGISGDFDVFIFNFWVFRVDGIIF